jgi:hypothetical protein
MPPARSHVAAVVAGASWTESSLFTRFPPGCAAGGFLPLRQNSRLEFQIGFVGRINGQAGVFAGIGGRLTAKLCAPEPDMARYASGCE